MSEGRMIGTGMCWSHRGVFEFDPDHVCTIKIDLKTGKPPEPDREAAAVDYPICDSCVRRANSIRAQLGLPLHETAAEHAARLGG